MLLVTQQELGAGRVVGAPGCGSGVVQGLRELVVGEFWLSPCLGGPWGGFGGCSAPSLFWCGQQERRSSRAGSGAEMLRRGLSTTPHFAGAAEFVVVQPLVTLGVEPHGRSSLISSLECFRGAGKERIAPTSSQSRGAHPH